MYLISSVSPSNKSLITHSITTYPSGQPILHSSFQLPSSPPPPQYHTLDEGLQLLLKGHHSVIEDNFVALVAVRSKYTLDSGYTPVHFSTTNYPTFAGMGWGFR